MKPIAIAVLGPPGTGKSTFAATIAEIISDKVLLCTTKPGEDTSFGYEKHSDQIDVEHYLDPGWCPATKEFVAADYIKLIRRIRGLRTDDTYGALIVDPGTDVGVLADHDILAPSRAASRGDMGGDGFAYWAQYGSRMKDFVRNACLLSTPVVTKPKFVIIPWHTQPLKEGEEVKQGRGHSTVTTKKKSADQRAAGISYEGNVLFRLDGSYRLDIAGDFSLVVYCDLEHTLDRKTTPFTPNVEYVIQVNPDEDRHAKVRTSPKLGAFTIPNSMVDLLKAVEDAS